MRNVAYSLGHSNAWSLVSCTVWEGLVGLPMLGKILRVDLGIKKPHLLPFGCLCFLLVVEDVSSQLPF
ncbi:rCG63101 [Rattus norvegicus]|uniref:RCG63101 n=1 Tax=Rattus norvegicus TaxID=10116 RepID=A6KSF9_RAT|nr:rCG63101 [Rattus norvegicus]